MKKIIFTLSLFLSMSAFSEDNYRKYIKFVHSDFKWIEYNTMMFEMFIFALGHCDDISRLTAVLENIPPDNHENIIHAVFKNFYRPKLDKKYINEYRFVGKCNIGSDVYRLHKKVDWQGESWAVIKFINTNAKNHNEIYEDIDSITLHSEDDEFDQRIIPFESYAVRGQRVKKSCENLNHLISEENAIKSCKRQLHIKF